MELFRDAGNRPQVQLRFNPDGFTSADGTEAPKLLQVQQAWGASNQRPGRMGSPHGRVYRAPEYHLTHVPEREVTVEHLFYDGYSWEDQSQTKGAKLRKAKRKREAE